MKRTMIAMTLAIVIAVAAACGGHEEESQMIATAVPTYTAIAPGAAPAATQEPVTDDSMDDTGAISADEADVADASAVSDAPAAVDEEAVGESEPVDESPTAEPEPTAEPVEEEAIDSGSAAVMPESTEEEPADEAVADASAEPVAELAEEEIAEEEIADEEVTGTEATDAAMDDTEIPEAEASDNEIIDDNEATDPEAAEPAEPEALTDQTPAESEGDEASSESDEGSTEQEATEQETAAQDDLYAGLPESIAALMSSADLARGEQLSLMNGCIGCHNMDPDLVMAGPTWYNIGKTAETRIEGMTAAEYLHNSIVNPNDYVVEGFAPKIMIPTYGETLSEQDQADLVAYLLGIGE